MYPYWEQKSDSKIGIDTTKRIKISIDFEDFTIENSFDIYLNIHRKIKWIKGYLININNKEEVIYTEDLNLTMIKEAKNLDGKWIPIEYKFYGGCGNSQGLFSLKPQEQVEFEIPIYRGNFKTKARLKFLHDGYIFYSDEFDLEANPKDFEPINIKEEFKNDPNGNPKLLYLQFPEWKNKGFGNK